MQNVTMGGAQVDPRAKFNTRFGCIPARIGSDHMVRLKVPIQTATRIIKAGVQVQMRVEDITRHPEVAKHAKWYCVYCRNEHESKEALLASHPDDKDLRKQQETHVYYAMTQMPAAPARPAKHDDKGKIIEAATEATPALVMILSDEE